MPEGPLTDGAEQRVVSLRSMKQAAYWWCGPGSRRTLVTLLALAGCAAATASAQRSTAAPTAQDPCQQERPLATYTASADYLRACPSASQRQDILKRMSLSIESEKGGYEDYKRFVLEFPDGLPLVPQRHLLALIGPEGLRVQDCIMLLKSGEEHGIVLERVRKSKALYRDFTPGEIDLLKQMGLSADIIMAMMESTFDAEREEQARRKSAGNAYTSAASSGYASRADGRRAGAQHSASNVQQYRPGHGEQVANCAARDLALDACSRMSGLLKSICESTARSQFPCQY